MIYVLIVLSLSLLEIIFIQVYEKDLGKDDRLAQFTAPITSLQQGLRSVRLLNTEMELLGAASLLVDLHIT